MLRERECKGGRDAEEMKGKVANELCDLRASIDHCFLSCYPTTSEVVMKVASEGELVCVKKGRQELIMRATDDRQ